MSDPKLIVPARKRITRRSALKLAGAGAAALVLLSHRSADAAGRRRTCPFLGQSSVQCPHSPQL